MMKSALLLLLLVALAACGSFHYHGEIESDGKTKVFVDAVLPDKVATVARYEGGVRITLQDEEGENLIEPIAKDGNGEVGYIITREGIWPPKVKGRKMTEDEVDALIAEKTDWDSPPAPPPD